MMRDEPGFCPPPAELTRPDLRGSFGMIATTHWLATGSGQAVLERGGNAFDAAVAAAFVLHLVEPHLNGPGGDLTAIFTRADDPRPVVLVGQGVAPAGATIDHFHAEGLSLVPGAGGLAAAVPGAVDALLQLLHDHGSWELADVLGFAIDYAEHGYPLLPGVTRAVRGVRDLFREHWPSSADFWLDADGAGPGDRRTNPAYGAVLRRLLEAEANESTREGRIAAARREWCTGLVPRSVADFLGRPHRHSTGSDHAGVITAEDFAPTGAGYENAVIRDFRGFTLAKIGPWGQGPLLLQALAILEGYPDRDLDPQTDRGAHLVIEALKLAFADRDAYYGDPDDREPPVPLESLLSDEYAARRRRLIREQASYEVRPGTVPGRTPFMPPLRTSGDAAAGVGEPTVRTGSALHGDTCHLDVVDRWGNLITMTPSGGWLQSSPHIPELGFCLGTRLQMTWLDRQSPSALRPRRRPRTTLSPTLVLRGGQPLMALGTPGGDQQEQWQLVFLLRTLVGGYSPQQAIDAPSLHTTSRVESFWPRTWTPGGVVVEDRMGDDFQESLRARGHRLTVTGGWTLGRLSAVWRDPGTGELGAAANSRGHSGYAAGR